MYKKSIMSKRIFDIEKEVNLAVLAENWVYFDWFKDVEYKIKDDKFYGVKIKLTSDTFHLKRITKTEKFHTMRAIICVKRLISYIQKNIV